MNELLEDSLKTVIMVDTSVPAEHSLRQLRFLPVKNTGKGDEAPSRTYLVNHYLIEAMVVAGGGPATARLPCCWCPFFWLLFVACPGESRGASKEK